LLSKDIPFVEATLAQTQISFKIHEFPSFVKGCYVMEYCREFHSLTTGRSDFEIEADSGRILTEPWSDLSNSRS